MKLFAAALTLQDSLYSYISPFCPLFPRLCARWPRPPEAKLLQEFPTEALPAQMTHSLHLYSGQTANVLIRTASVLRPPQFLILGPRLNPQVAEVTTDRDLWPVFTAHFSFIVCFCNSPLLVRCRQQAAGSRQERMSREANKAQAKRPEKRRPAGERNLLLSVEINYLCRAMLPVAWLFLCHLYVTVEGRDICSLIIEIVWY